MMKKTCAISFAAFYLLLSTGMYVCLLHCAGENLFKHQEGEVYSKNAKSHKVENPHEHEKDPCSKDKDCKCCKEHGQYAISENIQSAGSPFFSAIAILTFPTDSKGLFIFHIEIKSMDWPKGNAPPGFLKIPLYISNRTLLI